MTETHATIPLSQGAGYGVVVGLGALFALAMMGVTALLRRRGNVENAEEFTVAKRSLGTGLTAAGVTSSWTWSTTLLSSATVAYEYGVAGSFFYAACNSTQIMIFSNLAITDPCLYGCIAGIGAAALVTVTVTLFHDAKYSWDTLGAIRLTDEKGQDKDVAHEDPSYDPQRLRKAAYVARGVTIFLFLALFIIWPLSLYGTAYQFSKEFFTGWVIVSLLWACFSFGSVTVYPIIEERHRLLSWVRCLHKQSESVRQHRPNESQVEQEEKYAHASVTTR
ncbi:hypothetical protein KCV07_g8086, partial [Aureobasidium melanogenum]